VGNNLKKFYKTFTFYFIIIAIIVIVLNVTGNDDMNILMIGLNPLLNILDNSKVVGDFMSVHNYLWYVASFITNVLYGVVLDFIRIQLKNNNYVHNNIK